MSYRIPDNNNKGQSTESAECIIMQVQCDGKDCKNEVLTINTTHHIIYKLSKLIFRVNGLQKLGGQ